jgi:nuclear transcription factor Y, gamma
VRAEENKCRTLQKSGIVAAVTRTKVFDFLVNIVPRDEAKDAEAAAAAVGAGMPVTDTIAYYHVQPH